MPDPSPQLRPPLAERRPHVVTRHGETLVDDYFWMREREDPAVGAHLEAENQHALAWMEPTVALQQRLFDEILGRIQQTDLGVPTAERGWFHYTRTVTGLQYPIHCRRRGSLEAPEEVVLDLNQLAGAHAYLGLGALVFSDDGRHVAWPLDTTGFRVYTLRVRDLLAGTDLPDHAEDVDTVAWAADGRTLFYTVKDSAKRPHRLFRQPLGGAPELVFEERDERFALGISRTRSGDWLVLTAASHTQSEVRVLPAAGVGAWTLVEPRAEGHEYYLDHQGDRFYLLTNRDAPDFRLVSAPVGSPGAASWREEIAHRPGVMLADLDCFAGHRVVAERADGLVRLRVTETSGAEHQVAFPEEVYTAAPADNRDYEATFFRYRYESFTTPPSIYDYDLTTRTATLRKRTEVLGGYDPARYASARLWVTAADGARVPISIVHRIGVQRDGSAPLLLYGYGAYGTNLSATFSYARFSLLDRGVVFAIAHVRGGGERGKAWHDRGRMEHKTRTFDDFIACAEYLIESGWTRPERLAIQGGSAGGLLVGAVVNRRPDLFGMVLSQVPFVDVLNTMSDPTLPLTIGEYEEWGNPEEPAHYAWMRAYCPYTNLRPGAYPAMLVRTALQDSQVMYWEPAKYVARMRTLRNDDRPLLFRVHTAAGHGGASGRYDHLRDVAFDYAFLLSQWGLGAAGDLEP